MDDKACNKANMLHKGLHWQVLKTYSTWKPWPKTESLCSSSFSLHFRHPPTGISVVNWWWLSLQKPSALLPAWARDSHRWQTSQITSFSHSSLLPITRELQNINWHIWKFFKSEESSLALLSLIDTSGFVFYRTIFCCLQHTPGHINAIMTTFAWLRRA